MRNMVLKPFEKPSATNSVIITFTFKGRATSMQIETLRIYYTRLTALGTLQRCKAKKKMIISISANPVAILTVANAVSIHRNLAAVCVEVSLFF